MYSWLGLATSAGFMSSDCTTITTTTQLVPVQRLNMSSCSVPQCIKTENHVFIFMCIYNLRGCIFFFFLFFLCPKAWSQYCICFVFSTPYLFKLRPGHHVTLRCRLRSKVKMHFCPSPGCGKVILVGKRWNDEWAHCAAWGTSPSSKGPVVMLILLAGWLLVSELEAGRLTARCALVHWSTSTFQCGVCAVLASGWTSTGPACCCCYAST